MGQDMYNMYEEYEKSLKGLKRTIHKRQKRNAELANKDRNIGEQYIFNKNMIDITLMNEMTRDLEYSMEKIEMYLDYDDRKRLHKKAKKISDDILSPYTLYGLVPDGEEIYSSDIDNVEDIVCDVELQEEIVDLLDDVLTDRQKQVVQMYFWGRMTQEKIGEIFGVSRQGINDILMNAIEKLRNCSKITEIMEI